VIATQRYGRNQKKSEVAIHFRRYLKHSHAASFFRKRKPVTQRRTRHRSFVFKRRLHTAALKLFIKGL